MRENPQPSRLMSWDCDRYATFQCHAQSHVQDRKSTRLNSSHLGISYAVFCLKKKKKNCKQPRSVRAPTNSENQHVEKRLDKPIIHCFTMQITENNIEQHKTLSSTRTTDTNVE